MANHMNSQSDWSFPDFGNPHPLSQNCAVVARLFRHIAREVQFRDETSHILLEARGQQWAWSYAYISTSLC